MTFKEYINKGTVVVHDGKMHADDAFCVAMCNIMRATQTHEFIKFINIEFAPNHEAAKKFIDEGYLVMDVGLGEFDHHDKDNQRYRDEAKEWLLLVDYGKSSVQSLYMNIQNVWLKQK